jgi:hypothetical protein
VARGPEDGSEETTLIREKGSPYHLFQHAPFQDENGPPKMVLPEPDEGKSAVVSNGSHLMHSIRAIMARNNVDVVPDNTCNVISSLTDCLVTNVIVLTQDLFKNVIIVCLAGCCPRSLLSTL